MPDTTLITDAAADPKPAAPAAPSGEPNAKPDGGATPPATTPAPANPDGGTQDPTKPKDGEPKKPDSQDPKPPAPAALEPWKLTDLKVHPDIAIDPSVGERFEKLGQELKLSKDAAQKLTDLQVEASLKAVENSAAQWTQLKETWKQDTLKVLGPDATKQLGLAAAVRDKFGTQDLKQVLDDSGFGNHPAVVQFFISIGKAMSEDTFTEGKNKGAPAKSAAERIYPSMNK